MNHPDPRVILHVIQHLETGGEETLAVNLVAALAAARPSERHVLATLLGGSLGSVAEAMGVEVVVLAGRTKLGRLVALVALIRRLRPALIHARLSSAGFWCRIAARLAGYEGPLVQAHGGATYIAPGLKRRAMEGLFASKVTRHLCVSQSVADHLVAHGHPADTLTVIANGIPLSGIAARDETRPMADPPRLACVGRLSPEKGQDILVEAIGLWTSGAVTLDFLGDGPLRPRIAARVAERNLGKRVRMLGTVGDVGVRLQDYDGFVLPSLTEGLSLALLEAMAAGLPVVATAVGETPKTLGTDGILVPPGDAPALAAGIAAMVADSASLHRAANARRRVRRDHGIAATAAGYAEVFDRIIGAGR
jgi:glycosyltransferase involved in cell wall biosynthesis